MKHQATRGMILLTTMMLVSLMAVMVLSMLRGLIVLIAVQRTVETDHAQFHALESALNALIVSTPLGCQFSSCEFNFANQSYIYSTEDLGEFPCLRIQRDSASVASHHVLMDIAAVHHLREHLRVRLAITGSSTACMSSSEVWIPIGVLSWNRYVLEA